MTSCSLCDLPTGDSPVEGVGVDGSFCCRGCLEVARVLEDRDPDHAPTDAAVADHLAEALSPSGSTESETAESVDAETTYLSVGGMHCATCELFLESRALGTAGVLEATANYPTDTMRVRYDPDRIAEADVPGAVSGAGYVVDIRQSAGDSTDAGGATERTTTTGLLVGGFFGMMAMTWYAVFLYPTYFGFDPIVELGTFDQLYVSAHIWVFTSIVLFYTGYPLLRGAYVSLRARQPNMDLLVSTAATSAYLYSTLAMALGRTDLYFDVTIAVVLVVTAGTYYETRMKRHATGLLSQLSAATVSEVQMADGRTVPTDAVEAGDTLLVRPGERIPFDGTVADGVAAVDEALVSGESLPVTKREGDAVIGGSIVTDRPLEVVVGAAVSSTLDRLTELLWDVQSSRSGIQQVANTLATIFVPLVVVLAATITAWLLLTGTSVAGAALIGLTVLIVSCPCALGLATPLAVARGVGTAAERGVVVASETVFETLPEVDIVVLDKTGTLTEGRMRVVDADPVGSIDTATLLSVAAVAERFSDHPVANAITAGAAADDALSDPDERVATDGAGVSSTTAGHRSTIGDRVAGRSVSSSDVDVLQRGVSAELTDGELLVGHPSLFESDDWTVPPRATRRAEQATESGEVPVFVGYAGDVLGTITVGDTPRTEWGSVVEALAEDGRELIVLTGDSEAAASRFREHPAVSRALAGVPPDGKVAAIRGFNSRGTTAMIGDGSNDAPALAAADVGISVASGTALTADAADAIVVADGLEPITELFALAPRTRRRIRENLGWAFVYNGVAIPLALLGLLNPLLAAVAMAASSLLVVFNSNREL